MTDKAWALPERIPQLDGIRGVACLFVLVHHYATSLYQAPRGTVLWVALKFASPFLLSGVDLFFVLSGFLIGGILLDHKGSNNFFSTFYIRRVCRIFPVNYLLLALFVLALALGLPSQVPALGIWTLGHPMPLWSYATFTQNILMALRNATGAHWMTVTWSLAVEEQFYILFPLVVFFLPRKHLVWFAVASLLAAPAFRVFFAHRFGFYAMYTLLPCRMDTLMVGVIVALLLRDPAAVRFLRARQTALYLVLTALVVLLQIDLVHGLLFTLRYSVLALAYGFVILLAVLRSQGLLARLFQTRFLMFAGLLSYAIYMYHQAVNGTLHALVLGHEPRFSSRADIAVTLAAVAITFLLAYVSQAAMERPIRQWGRQFRYRMPVGEMAQAPRTETV